MKFTKLYWFFAFLLGLTACVGDKHSGLLNVRFAVEPDALNPCLTVDQGATQVLSHIFMPLVDFDPVTLQKVPVLASALPTVSNIDSGAMKGMVSLAIEIRPEAKWDDGTPVTGNDFVFTIKSILNPLVKSGAIRGYLSNVVDVQVDAANPKKLTIITQPYMLADDICRLPVMPAHQYDPTGQMKDITLADLSDTAKLAQLATDPRLSKFAESFQSQETTSAPNKVSGCGPYALREWQRGKFLLIERKKDWWGEPFATQSALFAAEPEQVMYHIVKDPATAINLLKGGQIDLMASMPPAVFAELKKENEQKNTLQLVVAPTLNIAYMGINGKHPALTDKNVRRALAHLYDSQSTINNILKGMASPAVSFVHPSKRYYNKDLTAIAFDIEAAKKLLADAGWKDSNNNGTLDKNIGGKVQELQLRFINPAANVVGKDIALLFKENAAKAGINIEVEQLEDNVFRERRKTRDFELFTSTFGSDLVDDDPRQLWHTSSNTPDGSNRFNFGNAQTDALIEKIGNTINVEQRDQMMKEFQKIVYDEQPCIILYAGIERMAANNRFKLTTTLRRPCYFETAYKLN